MDNPIKYSDFIQPDGSIEELIKQLEALSTTYSGMLKAVKDSANALKNSLKDVSGATTEGQNATKKAATEAERLAKEEEKLNFARSDAAKKIADLKAQQQSQNQINKLTIKLNQSAEGSYDKLSAQYSLNKIRLNQMSKAQREGTKEGQKLEKESKALYERMKELQEATGKNTLNVGNYGDALKDMPGILGNFSNGIAGVRAQFMKLLANPIVGFIALIAATFAAIVTSMKRSEDGQDRLNKVMTVASVVFDDVLDILTELGVVLFDTIPKAFRSAQIEFNLFQNDLQKGFLQLKKTWTEFVGTAEDAEKINEEIKAIDRSSADLLAEQQRLSKEMSEGFQQVADKANNLGTEIERDIKLAIRLADLQSKFNRDERRFIVENAKLSRESAKAMGEAEQMKLLDAQKSIDLYNEAFRVQEKQLENELDLAKQREKILKSQSSLAVDDIEAKKAIAEAEANVFSIEAKFDDVRRQRYRRLNMIRQEAFKQEKERSKAYIELSSLEQAALIRANERIISSDQSTFDERQKALVENAQLESSVLKDKVQMELQDLENRNRLSLINDQDYALQKKVIEAKLSDELLKINEKLSLEQKKILEKQTEDSKKQAEITEKSEKEKFDLSLQALAVEKELKDSEIELLQSTEAEKTRLRLESEKERLKSVLELNKTMGKQLSSEQIALMENQIALIDKKIGQAEAQKDHDLYSLAGLNLSDGAKSAISTSTQFALDQLSQFLAAQTQAAQQVVQNANSQAQSAKGRLEQELELARQGYAANVSQREKEFQLAKKNQERALAQQKKAQKAQMALDSIMQASNLITASSKIWSQLGFPWAIPALAIMWGSFATAKIQAAKATRNQQVQEYGDGGLEFLNGGSHASGNDIPIGTTRDGKSRRAEGGEALAIINRKNTSKYKRLLPQIIDSLNRGDFENKFANAYSMPGINVEVQGGKNDLRNLEKEVLAIRKQGDKKYFTDSSGKLIQQYKNRTRIFT